MEDILKSSILVAPSFTISSKNSTSRRLKIKMTSILSKRSYSSVHSTSTCKSTSLAILPGSSATSQLQTTVALLNTNTTWLESRRKWMMDPCNSRHVSYLKSSTITHSCSRLHSIKISKTSCLTSRWCLSTERRLLISQWRSKTTTSTSRVMGSRSLTRDLHSVKDASSRLSTKQGKLLFL